MTMNWKNYSTTLDIILQNAGYDVQISDVILARRAVDTVREIFIDQSGQLRCMETRVPDASRAKSVVKAARRYRVLIEDRRITTITTQLNSAEELPAVLRDLDAILKKSGA